MGVFAGFLGGAAASAAWVPLQEHGDLWEFLFLLAATLFAGLERRFWTPVGLATAGDLLKGLFDDDLLQLLGHIFLTGFLTEEHFLEVDLDEIYFRGLLNGAAGLFLKGLLSKE